MLVIGGLVIAAGVGVYFLTQQQSGGGGGSSTPNISVQGKNFTLAQICANAGLPQSQTNVDPATFASLCTQHGGTPAAAPTGPNMTVAKFPNGTVNVTRAMACGWGKFAQTAPTGSIAGKTYAQWATLCTQNGGTVGGS